MHAAPADGGSTDGVRQRARILEICSYPPPRAGWAVRVQYLKQYLDAAGHDCVVLNLGPSRRIPSDEYETVLSGWDYVRKVVRFTRAGYTAHLHANGKGFKGVVLALIAGLIGVAFGRRPFLTFHAGVEQDYFPREKARALAPVLWLLFAISQRVICNNEAVKEKIAAYGIAEPKIVPIPAFSVQYLEGGAGELPAALHAFYSRFPQVVFCYLQIRPEFNPVQVLQAFAMLSAVRRDIGLVLCGVSAHPEHALWHATLAEIEKHQVSDRVVILDDLDHGAFLEALRRASLYLRPPATDGVASSVLEALSLRVPVVAADNGARPAGVICYPARDVDRLAAVLLDVLDRRAEIAASVEPPPVRDTLSTEVALLTGAAAGEALTLRVS